MSIAYVVPAHRHPTQVLRLLRRLQSDSATVLVHIDARTDRAVHDEMSAGARELGAQMLERVPCFWGGDGLVRVGLMAIERLLDQGDAFDHLVYVTGQDYPLKPTNMIERFFAQSRGASFMSFFPLPGVWPGGGLDRFERWHLVSRLVLHVRLPWRRRIPRGLRPFGGGAHWALARPAAEHVLRFAKRDPRFMRFFTHVLHPEELIFQTILLNSDLASTVVNDNLRYIDWSVEPGPKTLGQHDLELALSSGKLFARKFDASADPAVLDDLDARLEQMAIEDKRAREVHR